MGTWGKTVVVVALAGMSVCGAWAHGGHWRPYSNVQFGVYLGDPWVFPPYYPYPVYAPRVYVPVAPVAPVVVTPPAPPVYIEQSAGQRLEPGYWYYCQEAQAYYPNVRTCPGPWQKVAPQPAQ